MEVLHGSGAFPLEMRSAVTVGFFDGVHLGHQAVIRRTVEEGSSRGLRPVAVTFDRHPREILTPGKVPKLLTTLRRKAGLIEALGIEVLLVLEFTERFSRWEPGDFVERILVEGLRTEHAVVGTNFTFGHKAAGTLETLTELGAAHGFSVDGVGLFALDGGAVSATSIREALAAGDLAWPGRALGRRYVLEGSVVPGAGRGAGLGFPTANLRTPDGILLPGRGVYAGRAYWDEQTSVAAINVGVNPTFGEEPLHAEAYLLDFEGDLQGRVLGIEFWQRLRNEIRFESAEALADQIAEDVERTRSIVGGAGQGAAGAGDPVWYPGGG